MVTERGESITLLDDEGKAHEFTLVEVIEVEQQRYAVLQPEDPDESAVLFRVEGETLTPVDDDEEFDRVVEVLRDLQDDSLVVEDGDDDGDEDDEDEDDGAAGPTDREVN